MTDEVKLMFDDIKSTIVNNTPSAFIILNESDDFGALFNIMIERDENDETNNSEFLRKNIPASIGNKKIIITYVPFEYIKTFKLKERSNV
ncbi:hypothetical protein N9W84_01545 [bacterium]|nr:hypothetical protein [bacterium]